MFIPFIDEFYYGHYPFTDKFTDGKHSLEMTLVTGKDADLEVINTFSEYGLIILNTHGMRKGVYLLTKLDKLDEPTSPGQPPITEADLKTLLAFSNNLPLDKVASGEIELTYTILKKAGSTAIECFHAVLIKAQYFRGIPKLNEAVVFGNHCYSGITTGTSGDNMMEAWKSLGAITYYGYAFSDGGVSRSGK